MWQPLLSKQEDGNLSRSLSSSTQHRYRSSGGIFRNVDNKIWMRSWRTVHDISSYPLSIQKLTCLIYNLFNRVTANNVHWKKNVKGIKVLKFDTKKILWKKNQNEMSLGKKSQKSKTQDLISSDNLSWDFFISRIFPRNCFFNCFWAIIIKLSLFKIYIFTLRVCL